MTFSSESANTRGAFPKYPTKDITPPIIDKNTDDKIITSLWDFFETYDSPFLVNE